MHGEMRQNYIMSDEKSTICGEYEDDQKLAHLLKDMHQPMMFCNGQDKRYPECCLQDSIIDLMREIETVFYQNHWITGHGGV